MITGDTQPIKVKLRSINPQTQKEEERTAVASLAGQGPPVRATFVKLLKERAWAELENGRMTMDAQRFMRLEAALFQDMAIGLYEWGDKVHDKIDGSLAGFRLLLEARLTVGSLELPPGFVEAAIEQYGYDKLTNMMLLADGKPLPKGPSPDQSGANGSPTNGSPQKSSSDSPELTPTSSTV